MKGGFLCLKEYTVRIRCGRRYAPGRLPQHQPSGPCEWPSSTICSLQLYYTRWLRKWVTNLRQNVNISAKKLCRIYVCAASSAQIFSISSSQISSTDFRSVWTVTSAAAS